jgi:hypothetical protein
VILKKWKSQGKAVEVTLNSKLETFVWISSKNSASEYTKLRRRICITRTPYLVAGGADMPGIGSSRPGAEFSVASPL